MKALALAESQIKRHEGLQLLPYEDTAGNVTIGYGRNLDAKGISADEAEYLFANDIQHAYNHCKTYIYWELLTTQRQAVLIDMCFNLGNRGFDSFRKMHEALRMGDYVKAGIEILDSKAANTNNGLLSRYSALSKQMREG